MEGCHCHTWLLPGIRIRLYNAPTMLQIKRRASVTTLANIFFVMGYKERSSSTPRHTLHALYVTLQLIFYLHQEVAFELCIRIHQRCVAKYDMVICIDTDEQRLSLLKTGRMLRVLYSSEGLGRHRASGKSEHPDSSVSVCQL